MQLSGKTIIVTGASQGIGKSLAKLLAARGAHVVLAARSASAIEALAKELPGSLAVQADMTQPEDVARLVETARSKFGRVDALVNNAGRGMWVPVEKIDIRDYADLVELNLYGPLRAMQAVIPVMRAQGGGTIVNVSSMLTRVYYPNLAAYASTKYALNALTLTARAELEKDGIVVSLVRPKLVDTDFGTNAVHTEPGDLRDHSNPNRPPMDTPEFVAEKIVEALESGAAETDL